MLDPVFLKGGNGLIAAIMEQVNGLPQEFLLRMRQMLDGEYPAFLNCMKQQPYRALRINTLKCEEPAFQAMFPVPLTPSPFAAHSYYLPYEAQGLGNSPLHHAGAFYLQEPSAASAVTMLDPQPGERILDLCAAPGGKTTQIAALLQGEGLVWANEVVGSRARTLLSNVERMGVRNAVVSSCHPQKLCERLAGFFDRVLVDAPCSGEGMFRKNPEAAQEWSSAHVEACAQRQQMILQSAAQAVRPGGVLVYSTCTYAPQENEQVISAFLQHHPDFSLEPGPMQNGRTAVPAWGGGEEALSLARRIFPMDGGEGHFVARLRRQGEGEAAGYTAFVPDALRGDEKKQTDELFVQLFGAAAPPWGEAGRFQNAVLLFPHGLPELTGLGVLRAGVPAGELKKGRVEPEHALFMAAKPEQLRQVLALYLSDTDALQAFLHGEELSVPESWKGYAGVAVQGMILGFGKCSGGRLKNRYPKGLRL